MNTEQAVQSADRPVQIPGKLVARLGATILPALGLVLTSQSKLSVLSVLGVVIMTIVAGTLIVVGSGLDRPRKN
jgi:hypothetical protein